MSTLSSLNRTDFSTLSHFCGQKLLKQRLSRTRRLPCTQTDKPKCYNHIHTYTARLRCFGHIHTQKVEEQICTVMPLFGSVMPEALWASPWAMTWYMRTAGGVKIRNNCATCVINGWNTYLTCSADLWKHTSGCSANKSRLYCPLTSAELLIVIVTQLQRRACTGLGQLVSDELAHSS